MSFLYDHKGKRKYLTIEERNAFLEAARMKKPDEYTFCLTLAYTGARISEVLALTPERIDFYAGLIVIECLKKRRKGIFRAVPVPKEFLQTLQATHGITADHDKREDSTKKIWPWCRTTAWKKVRQVMLSAEIVGVQASAKGLRHAFAIAALQTGLPINLVRKWLGHSRLETTAIYAEAVGMEERSIAKCMWQTFDKGGLE